MSTFAGIPLATPDQLPQDYMRMLLHGPQGSGKTTLASTIAQIGPTLLIDLIGERGVRSISGDPWIGNISIVRPDSITALDDIYWELAKGNSPFKAVILDSLTAAQKMATRYIAGHEETSVREIKRGTKSTNSFQQWGQTNDILTDIGTFWFGLADGQRTNPLHVIITAQTKQGRDEDAGVKLPDVQPGALGITLAAPDYVLYTDIEDNPDHMVNPATPPSRHIVRLGGDPNYRTKARIPRDLWGKVPPVLGRNGPLDLVSFARVMRIGGIPQPPQPGTPA